MSDETKTAQVVPLYHEKAIVEIDGWWALYRRQGNELVPVGIRKTKAEAEGWLGYPLPVTDLTPRRDDA